MVYLRIELQPLYRLPSSNAIAFTIRAYLLSLEDIVPNPAWTKHLKPDLGRWKRREQRREIDP
ncbi:heme-dependent oxidative N-demethylase subunit alpha family protein [Pseudomonas abieticivorans]|uniref:heme-dependent oxidative N-demethylase subunit alpha family protein n=1 Tax=Pseudomonas abieticivorans TaxID=2931382 RepID=UPI003F68F4EC